MKIRARLLHMADSEIKAMIPPYFFSDIKRRDPKPLFKAYVVGQEGQAESTWVGVGKMVKNWFKDAIGKLVRRIHVGLKLFHNHAETNEPDENREAIGEVAGSRAKIIDGKFSAVIAAYIYPEYKNLPLDIASVEADVFIEDNVDDEIHAINVDDVTGIALGNSAVDSPGFPGATLLGELQAFAGQSQSNKGGRDVDITISDVKDFIKADKAKPSDLFGLGELTDDPAVKGYVEEERKIASSGEYAHRKRTDDKFDEERKKWEKEKEEKDKEIKKLKTDGAKIKAVDLFNTKVKERKLDKKQSKFIETKRSDFEPEDLENLDKEVDKSMDSMLEEYKKTAEIFGHKTEEVKEDKKPGSEPGSEEEEEGDASHIPD